MPAGVPSGPLCAVCSTFINSGELAVYAHGTVSHLRCRGQAARDRVIETVASSAATRGRAGACPPETSHEELLRVRALLRRVNSAG